MSITNKEREEYRAALKQFKNYSGQVQAALEGKSDLTPVTKSILNNMTGTQELSGQARALESTYDLLNTQYDDALMYAARDHYSPFCEYMFRNEVPVLHQEFIIKYMEMIHHGDILRLGITLPPGAAKTTYASIRYAAWHLGRRPGDRYLQGGHTQTFAKDQLGKPVRDLISETRYKNVFPEMVLSASSAAADYFKFAGQRGYYKAFGVGTSCAGYRAEIIGVDDPFGKREDAESETIRKKMHTWFDDDFGTRGAHPRVPIFVVNCLVGDSKISMADGSWKYMKDVELGDEVVTYVKGEDSTDTVTMHVNQGSDEIWEVKTGQNTIRGNARHPLLVESTDGVREFIQIQNLKKGDKLVTQSKHIGTRKYNAELAWSLGFMYGDGWVTINNKKNYDKIRNKHYATASWVTCVATCPKYSDRHSRCMRALSEEFDSNWIDHSGKYGYFHSKKAKMGRFLHSFGLGAGAKNKRIPKEVFEWDHKSRIYFLEGMTAADGCKRGEHGAYSINVSNMELIRDFRHLCQITGVSSSNTSEQYFVTQPPNSPRPVEGYTASFTHNVSKNKRELTTIRSVTNTMEFEDVFDITVGDDATFYVDGVVCKNTRWHEDDLVGHELDKMEQGRAEYPWTIINIPAIAEDDDPLGRDVGIGLWPEKFGTAFYEGKKRSLTGRSWNSLYQGHPTDEAGGLLSNSDVTRYKTIPKDERDESGALIKKVVRHITLSVDCAEKANERADFTAATVWLETMEHKHYMIHATRTKKEFIEMVEWIEAIARQYNVDEILVEDRGAGTQYIQLRKNGGAPAPITAVNTKQQAKHFRFDGVTPQFSTGVALLPELSTWIADVERELFAFPNGRYDDYVDTVSQYLSKVRDSQWKGGATRMRAGLAQHSAGTQLN